MKLDQDYDFLGLYRSATDPNKTIVTLTDDDIKILMELKIWSAFKYEWDQDTYWNSFNK